MKEFGPPLIITCGSAGSVRRFQIMCLFYKKNISSGHPYWGPSSIPYPEDTVDLINF